MDRLDAQEIAERIQREAPAWRFEKGRLVRTYATSSWQVTLLAANTIGFVAEVANHHPDLLLRYRSLRVELVTHDVDGLSEKDFALATQIETLLAGWSQIR